MKVVEKDKHIHGMLHEELERCRGMVISLQKELSNLPKGSVHKRERRYKKEKIYLPLFEIPAKRKKCQ